MKQFLLKSILILLSTTCAAQVTSTEIQQLARRSGKDIDASVIADIATNVGPNIRGEITSINKTPINNLYELIANKQIIYVTGDGKYMLVGSLYQSLTRANLTKMKLDSLSTLDFLSLPLEYAIKKIKGDGKREIAVFCNPDNIFCSRLEKEVLSKVNNITIHTFLLLTLHPESKTKSENIWCSKEQIKTWDKWMLNKIEPPKADKSECKPPLDEIVAFANKKGIYGTPAIIIKSNNRLVLGVTSAQELEKLME